MLDRAADAAAAGAAERAAGGGDEAERRAQPAAAGVGEREHGAARAHVLDGGRVPLDGRRAAGVDRDDRDVERVVERGDAPERDLAVGAPHRDLVAAQHVRVRQHAAVGDHHARAAAPAAAEPDDGRPDPLRGRRDRLLKPFENRRAHLSS